MTLEANPHWDKTLTVQRVYGDPHFSSKWGFRLASLQVGYEFDFDSGLVYTSRDDATQAADQVAHVAWQWVGVCHGAASRASSKQSGRHLDGQIHEEFPQ